MISQLLVERLRVRYSGLNFRAHLKKIVWEYKAMLHEYRPNDVVWAQKEKAVEFHASTYFFVKFGIHLTAGDIDELDSDFDRTADSLWGRIKCT